MATTHITAILRLAAARGFVGVDELARWRCSPQPVPAEGQTDHCLVARGLLTDTQLAELLASVRTPTAEETETVACLAQCPESAAPPVIPGYRITAMLGHGGSAVVYHAWQERPKREVAIKTLKAGILASEEARARFTREAEAAANLSHPAIVSIYEFGEADGVPYFSMELVRGMRLDRYGERRHLSLRDRLSLMLRVCRGVAHAHHRGVIHRDLKPSNILVNEAGEPKIMDFGIAKMVSPDEVQDPLTETETGHLIGTVAYMAPEQALGRADAVDTRTDVYALGAVLYQVLTGKLPHWAGRTDVLTVVKRISGDPPVRPTKLNKAIGLDVESIILKALEKRKEDRYQSADALADDIERYLAGEPVQARRGASTYYIRKWAYRHRAYLALAGVAVIAVVAVTAWSFVKIRHERNAALAAEAQTRAAKEQVERDSYWTKISLVASRLRERAYGSAVRLLESCPPNLRHWEWGYLERLCRPELQTLGKPDGEILSAAFRRQGAAVATSSPDGTVCLWDAVTGERMHSFQTGAWSGRASDAFSPDGTKVLMPQRGGAVDVWDTESRSRILTLEGHAAPVEGAAFSADGARAVTWDSDGTAIIWALSKGEQIRALTEGPHKVRGAALNSDGTRVVTFDDGHEAVVWEVAGGAPVLVIAPPDQHMIKGACFGPDGKVLATAGTDAIVRLWDLKTGGELTAFKGHVRPVVSVAFNATGTDLVTASEDQTARVWDAETGRQLGVLAGHDAAVLGAGMTPDGTHVVTTSADGTARIWDLSRLNDRFASAAGRFHLLALGPDSRTALGTEWTPEGGWRGVLYDALAGCLVSRLGLHESFVESGALSPDGARAATMEATGRIRVWDTARGEQTGSFPALKGSRLHPYAWSSRGERLLAIGLDEQAHVWDAERGADLGPLSAAGATQASFDPEGRRAVTSHYDTTVRVWDAASARLTNVLKGHVGAVWSATFSPDGRRIATASEDMTVRVWDAQTGAQLAVLRGHHEPAQYASFSPDGHRVVSAGRSGVGKVWDWENERELVTLPGPSVPPLFSVVFSDDGRRVVMAGPGHMLVHTADVW